MELYSASLTQYKRLITREVKIGDLLLGNGHPLLIQAMTTTDTMDTDATVAQSIRCIEAGAELVRITAPSKKEAENLRVIRDRLRSLDLYYPVSSRYSLHAQCGRTGGAYCGESACEPRQLCRQEKIRTDRIHRC